jgi:hypothetical protein
MNNVARSLSIAALILLLSAGVATADTAPPSSDAPVAAPASTSTDAPEIPAATAQLPTEVVFCIDCSGSMSESIVRAQEAIGFLIDEMQAQTPKKAIRVGIIRYGTGSNALEVCPLTDNPKEIRRYLNRLEISGGAEFVGTFIKNAVEKMRWAEDGKATRKIVMVGNETTFQGPIDFRMAAENAFESGFTVSAIYCPTTFDEQSAQTARATAGTRVAVNGVLQRPMGISFNRAMLDVENSWILTAYFGRGEVMKLSVNPRRPLYRYSPEEVQELVEVRIPQQKADMEAADAAFSEIDMTGKIPTPGRRVSTRR